MRCIPYSTTVETTLTRRQRALTCEPLHIDSGGLVVIGVIVPDVSDDGSANEPFALDWLVMSVNRVDHVEQ